jgi:transposase
MSLEPHAEPAAIRTHFGAIFVSLELSRSNWLVTSLIPGGGEKMSKHVVGAGDVAGLLARFSELKRKALARTGENYPIVVIQEAGLDAFWIHRVLEQEGIESHVVDAASIAVSRRRRRAKTDKIDGEALLRALLAFKRGEPRVCSMVRAPTPEEEDRRRICRERKVLIAERVRHVNRIKGLLFSQGIGDYRPLGRDRRRALEMLRTGDGRDIEPHLKKQIGRELDRLELLMEQIVAVEGDRDAMLKRGDRSGGRRDAPERARARADVGEREEHRSGIRRCPVDGGALPIFRQSPANRRLRRFGADALAERVDRPRTGRIEGRQSAPANDDDSTGLAMAASPAGFGLGALVP